MQHFNHGEAAEKYVLGALLLGDAITLDAVTSIISISDFYAARYRKTFEAILRLADQRLTEVKTS